MIGPQYCSSTAVPIAPPKAAPPPQNITKGKGKQHQVDDLERELLGLDEDAEGDIDYDIESVVTKPIARKEEEEEEEEVFRPPKPSSPVPQKAQPLSPHKPRPVKSAHKPRVEAKAPAATPQPSQQKQTQPIAVPAATTPSIPAPSIPAPPRSKPRQVQKKEQVQLVQQKEPVQQTGLNSKKESVQKTGSTLKKDPVQKREKKAKPIPVLPTAPLKSASYADEEVIEFGRPAKRPRLSTPQRPLLPPTPPATITLSLPGGTSSFEPPPPPPHSSRGTGSSSRNVPPETVPAAAASMPIPVPASPPMMGQYESDEEEDWDEVSTANLASTSLARSKSNSNIDDNAAAYELALEQDIFGDVFEEVDGNDEGQTTTQIYGDGDGEEEEIDMNAFEQELNEHMEVAEAEDDSDDEVFGGPVVESEPDLHGGGARQPISLNRLASGAVGAEVSEEDYSSSDDSDDD